MRLSAYSVCALAFLGAFLMTHATAETDADWEDSAMEAWALKRTKTAMGKTRGPGGAVACRCAGKSDQGGSGAACELYGFRTTWCYVENACDDEAAVPASGMPGMKKLWACHTYAANPSKDVQLQSTKVTLADNKVKASKGDLMKALKSNAKDELTVSKQNGVSTFAHMQVQKQQSLVNKWGAMMAKASMFPSGGKGQKAASQVKTKMEAAQEALKAAKAVIRFAKYKKLMAKNKADKSFVEIQSLKSTLKMTDSALKKAQADSALAKAGQQSDDKFTWPAQQEYWQKQEAKKKYDEASVVVMSATAKHKDAVAKYGKNGQQSLEAQAKLAQAKVAMAQVKKAYHTSEALGKGTMAGGIRTVQTKDGKLKITVPADKVKEMKKNPMNKMADAAAKSAGKQTSGKGLKAIQTIQKEAKKEIKAAQKQAKKAKKEAKKEVKAVKKEEKNLVKKEASKEKKRGQKKAMKAEIKAAKAGAKKKEDKKAAKTVAKAKKAVKKEKAKEKADAAKVKAAKAKAKVIKKVAKNEVKLQKKKAKAAVKTQKKTIKKQKAKANKKVKKAVKKAKAIKKKAATKAKVAKLAQAKRMKKRAKKKVKAKKATKKKIKALKKVAKKVAKADKKVMKAEKKEAKNALKGEKKLEKKLKKKALKKAKKAKKLTKKAVKKAKKAVKKAAKLMAKSKAKSAVKKAKSAVKSDVKADAKAKIAKAKAKMATKGADKMSQKAVTKVKKAEKLQSALASNMAKVTIAKQEAKAKGDMEAYGAASQKLGKLKAEAKIAKEGTTEALESADKANDKAKRADKKAINASNKAGPPPTQMRLKIKSVNDGKVIISSAPKGKKDAKKKKAKKDTKKDDKKTTKAAKKIAKAVGKAATKAKKTPTGEKKPVKKKTGGKEESDLGEANTKVMGTADEYDLADFGVTGFGDDDVDQASLDPYADGEMAVQLLQE